MTLKPRQPPTDESELHAAINEQIHELADMKKADMLGDEGKGIRALLALAVHLIQCHKP